MSEMFDMDLRALRRDRAARMGTELFLHERVFDDCLERLDAMGRRFSRALLLGCPDPAWPARLAGIAEAVTVADPGPLFARQVGGDVIVEDQPALEPAAFDLILAIGTLDTVNALPLALFQCAQALDADGLLLGAMSGGETLPLLRQAMAAADRVGDGAAPRVHPRVAASALAPLLEQAGLVRPVVDVDRVEVGYATFERLIDDLRRMAATNLLSARSRQPLDRAARAAAMAIFDSARRDGRATETFEILHFAAWKPARA